MADETTSDEPLTRALSGLELRSIGPALMGGRIADIAVDPRHRATWYVAVASGGVWKTVNAGVTWTPIFDDQPSFSIGCIRLDPNRPDTVWVGTGEAVSGRHVAWGDGVYRSLDGGRTWTQMGLTATEHIADILIDPRDGNIVYVAAEGPLWSSGGERGLYKTTDGGQTWDLVLSVDDDTGVTSAVLAPDDADTIYAATYQRRRSVRSFVGGGPGSGIHVSNDGGSNWDRVTTGLPEGDLGKIGLAVTPANPDLVYATVEAADRDRQGFHRSRDRGRTWERRNSYVSNGTGPHYYQEIFASPVDADRVYQVDVFLHATADGGKTFHNLEAPDSPDVAEGQPPKTRLHSNLKHSDNHVVWIDPDPTFAGQHLLVGTDAGLYESFDDGGAWRHVSNLPVSQFYRVAVDHSVPFTNVMGGAQDLGTLYGPTRTLHLDGVRNQDWSVRLGADGYRAAFDPDETAISYVTFQVGNLFRHDNRTMELTDIKPMGEPDDPPERWNWDAPLVLSPHQPGRIYYGSQRVWRSDDRGSSWTPISPDLTTDTNRYELPTGGRVWSVDALYDHLAMSAYATTTGLSESPVVAGLLYAGTDDGLVQVSENGGDQWRRAGELPDLGRDAFVNDVKASRHDGDGVFVAADDHKSGDYRPHLFESTDRGRTWRSIRGDLPDGAIVWVVEQDHVDPNLLFAGTERGLFVSLDHGQHWHRFTGGVPTISFRDLAIQRRDDDLVGATFGRGFYVLDDYGPLRSLSSDELATGAALFPVRQAWRYVPYQPMQSPGQPTLGATAFRTPNPSFGATFAYHLATDQAADLQPAKKRRREAEKPQEEAGDDVAFPGWDALWAEHVDREPTVLLVVRDDAGQPIRALPAATKAGLHRTSWDLRHPSPDPVDLSEPEFRAPWDHPAEGPLAPAGTYSVELVRILTGEQANGGSSAEILAGPQRFDVVDIPAVAERTEANGENGSDATAFARQIGGLARLVSGAQEQVEVCRTRVKHLRVGLATTPAAGPERLGRLDDLHRQVEELGRRLTGDPVRERLSEPDVVSIAETVGRINYVQALTTGNPTATQRRAANDAAQATTSLVDDLSSVVESLRELSVELDDLGGPWTPR